MEDYLQEIFKASNINGEKFNTKNKPSNTSVIKALELNLKNYVNVESEGNLKLLNEIRNKAVHENAFSFNKAKKEKSVLKILTERNFGKKKKSKEILLQLIFDLEEYVKNTKVK